ncbi:MAG: CHRD domain-containing protein [Bacteroidota bacterium]|nr:CHRD domain-containing protein [Bacteroidota bacterium]
MKVYYRFIFSLIFAVSLTFLPLKKSSATIYTFDDGVTGNEEVPPNPSTGVGNISGNYNDDGNILTFNLVFTGLSAPTTSAHFYGPAQAGAEAGVQISFAGFPVGVTSAGYSNQYILSDTQEQEFLSGLWYVNIHTSSYPNGELRGQLEKSTTPVLNLTTFLQGFYNFSSNTMVPDTVNVYLRNSTAPYNLMDSATGQLNSSGVKTFDFFNAINGLSYFLVVKHRNSIETWSITGQSFSNSVLDYNFTTAQNQAFGNNLEEVDTNIFAIYSGDVNQDGTVDILDMSLIDNDVRNFVSGYVNSDLNGDEFADLADYLLADNNAFDFVSVIRP